MIAASVKEGDDLVDLLLSKDAGVDEKSQSQCVAVSGHVSLSLLQLQTSC